MPPATTRMGSQGGSRLRYLPPSPAGGGGGALSAIFEKSLYESHLEKVLKNNPNTATTATSWFSSLRTDVHPE